MNYRSKILFILTHWAPLTILNYIRLLILFAAIMLKWYSYSISQGDVKSLAIRCCLDTGFGVPGSFTPSTWQDWLESGLPFGTQWLWSCRPDARSMCVTGYPFGALGKKKHIFSLNDPIVPYELGDLFFPSYFHMPIWALVFPFKGFSGLLCSCQRVTSRTE